MRFCPGLQVRVRLNIDLPDILLRQLRQRELDIITIDPAYTEAEPDVRKLLLEPHQGYLVVRAGHPLLSKKDLTLQDIVQYPLASIPLGPNRLSRMAKNLSGLAAKQLQCIERWSPGVISNSITALKTIVAHSDGVMIVSLKMVRRELVCGDLAVLPLLLPWLQARFAVLHLSHRDLTPAAQAVVQSVIIEDRKSLEEEVALAAEFCKAPTARRSSKFIEKKSAV